MTTVAQFLEEEWKIPLESQPPNYYQLLGIANFESNIRAISAAAQQRSVLLNEYQLNPDFAPVLRELNREIARAKICLLSQQKRIAYDQQLAASSPSLARASLNSASQAPGNRSPAKSLPDPAPLVSRPNGVHKPDLRPPSGAGVLGAGVDPYESLEQEYAPNVDEPAKQTRKPANGSPATQASRRTGDLDFGETRRYTPVLRPPAPWLYIMDDSQNYKYSEAVRLRNDYYVIGRTTGDIIIPHDPLIDPVHVCLQRMPRKEGETAQAWRLKDLNSETGTFLNIFDATLRNNDELKFGNWRAKIQIQKDNFTLSILCESNGGVRREFKLRPGVHNVGRDESLCQQLCFPSDMMLEPHHAQLTFNEEKKTWLMHSFRSLNGTWLRLRAAYQFYEPRVVFQAGEQRFSFSADAITRGVAAS